VHDGWKRKRSEERAVQIGCATSGSEEQASERRRMGHTVGEGRSSEQSEARGV
jgi:hypothetical protein